MDSLQNFKFDNSISKILLNMGLLVTHCHATNYNTHNSWTQCIYYFRVLKVRNLGMVSWFSAHVLTKLKSRCQPDAFSSVAVLISKVCCQAHVVVIIQFLMAVSQSYFQFLEDACISCHVAPLQIQKHRNFLALDLLYIVRLQIHVWPLDAD